MSMDAGLPARLASDMDYNHLRRWEAIGLAAGSLAVGLICAFFMVRQDYIRSEAAFLHRVHEYEFEIYRKFGTVDAILTTFSSLDDIDKAFSSRSNVELSESLLESYPYISAIGRLAVETGAEASPSDPATKLQVASIAPSNSVFASMAGSDLLADPLIAAAAEDSLTGEDTEISDPIALPDGGTGILAIQGLRGMAPSAEAVDGDSAMAHGAMALFLDGEAFFGIETTGFSHLSVWLLSFNPAIAEPRPLFETDTPPDSDLVSAFFDPFETALQVEFAGRSFWVAANASPTLAEFQISLILLVFAIPLLVGFICFVSIRSHRRMHWRARQFEGQLSRSERRFKDFVDASVDWYWEMDNELRFSYFSERFTDVTGVPTEMLLGRTRRETGIPEVDPIVWQEHLVILDERLPFRDFVHPRRLENGEQIWIAINGKPHFDDKGEFLGYRGTGRDITQQVRRERELAEARKDAEAANRAQSEFLASMSHELRTPLHAIIGFSQLLKEQGGGQSPEPESVEFAGHINSSGQNLLSLINDLLDISKIESGKDVLRETNLDAAELVQSAAGMAAERQDTSDIDFNVNIGADLPALFADRRKVLQILTNILSNAFKFTPAGGAVGLECWLDAEKRFNFSIADTGIGLAPEDVPKAFAAFSQVDKSLERKFEGAGLGLPLTRRLVDQHQAEIWVDSEVGAGARFTVRFPRARTVEPGSAKAARLAS